MIKQEIIGIVGAGTMGSGIAQLAAQYGHRVLVFDSSHEARTQLVPRLRELFDRLVAKSKISAEEAQQVLSRITVVDGFEAFSSCDTVIEAIQEELEAKQQVFADVELCCSPRCVLASNTSSLSITALAAACKHPERVVGLHFFNPAPLMKLVEVVSALQTDGEPLQRVETLVAGWQKTPVRVQDTPGFIVNRIARPFYGEALKMLEEQFADTATIDWAMRERGGFRMGPFELMDLIGIDVNYAVSQSIFQSMYFDPRYRPSVVQQRYVEAGRLGKKTGHGFYRYGESVQSLQPSKDQKLAEAICNRIIVLLMNEAIDALFRGIASLEDIETAMTQGTNYPKGLLAWADEWGLPRVLQELETLQHTFGEDRYRPSPLLRSMVEKQSTFEKHRSGQRKG